MPVYLWDDRILSNYPVMSVLEGKSFQWLCTALNKFSNFILRIWFQSVYSSFVQYLQIQWTIGTQLCIDINVPLATTYPSSKEFCKAVEAGIDCLHYITKHSCWERNNGYRIFFWSWTPEFKDFSRDNIPGC